MCQIEKGGQAARWANLNRVLSIGVHDVDLTNVASVGNECYLRPVRRPIRTVVKRWMVCQVFLVSSNGVHYIDFTDAISQGSKNNP